MATIHAISGNESLGSVAQRYGFFEQTLWDHPDNSHLRAISRNPAAMQPGDKVHVPDLRQKTIDCATGQRHPFVRRGVPGIFRLRLETDIAYLALEPYRLRVDDGEERSGTTDADGWLTAYVALHATSGALTIPRLQTTITLRFGELDPGDTFHGMVQRLKNLGYPCTRETWRPALMAFQKAQAIQPDGVVTDSVLRLLDACHIRGSIP